MSQSAPGWYQDHDDPRLARWWDGERWTEHTLVLDEQDWSTEPDPPAGSTRFPVDTGSVTAVEATPAGFEEDIYAPIRDPWGEEPAAAPVDAPTQAWATADDPSAWDEHTAAAGTVVAPVATGWDDDRWVAGSGKPPGGPFSGSPQDWPTWAKVAAPLAVLALVLLVLVASGALGGDDDTPLATDSSSTSTTEVRSLADAADAALRAAGTGPFTASTFTTLIPLACEAADQSDPALLTERIVLLGYDADTIAKLIQGLRAGTSEYCPEEMAGAPTLLNQVETAALTGGTSTTSTSSTVAEATTTTRKPTTGTTKKPTTTTKPPATTTTQPATTTTQPATTTTLPTTTTTQPTTTTTAAGP